MPSQQGVSTCMMRFCSLSSRSPTCAYSSFSCATCVRSSWSARARPPPLSCTAAQQCKGECEGKSDCVKTVRPCRLRCTLHDMTLPARGACTAHGGGQGIWGALVERSASSCWEAPASCACRPPRSLRSEATSARAARPPAACASPRQAPQCLLTTCIYRRRRLSSNASVLCEAAW